MFGNRYVYCNGNCINVKAENLVSVMWFFKWNLISLNTEKLRSASACVTDRVHANTSKILMFGKESGSADTKDFTKYQVNRPCPTALNHILNHWICRHAIIQIALGEASLV